MTMNMQGKKKKVLMFPCSIKQPLANEHGSPAVQFIELHLRKLPALPPHLHTTNGLPLHLMPPLKKAFDKAKPKFSTILKKLQPDLLIYDLIQHWAPLAASKLEIPSVVFITTSVTMASNMFHLYLNSSTGIPFPFSTIYYRCYESGHMSEILESSANGRKDKDRVMECVNRSSSIVLVKSFKEIEGKYSDYLSVLTGKKIVPVEIAYGLELSNVNFIWVFRFPKVERKLSVSEAFPLGFLERVKDTGLVIEGWAPQAKILGHENIGGFVSRCGWSSSMEAMKFGVPIIAMPMHLDQPVNARLMEEVGIGMEVVRDNDGRLRRENMAVVVRQVVVSELGKAVREKAKKISTDLRLKGEEEIDAVAVELLQLCLLSGGRGRRFARGKGYPLLC
ncbi:unnamed protein product [Lactuca saligna]|uniref:Glycosyltransferase n=1 Tax=Lactuca saligna TaxID=75948 RepID=A0AA35ZRT6_LACSI|nr:unnamed protein product [Lactuca saligna]